MEGKIHNNTSNITILTYFTNIQQGQQIFRNAHELWYPHLYKQRLFNDLKTLRQNSDFIGKLTSNVNLAIEQRMNSPRRNLKSSSNNPSPSPKRIVKYFADTTMNTVKEVPESFEKSQRNIFNLNEVKEKPSLESELTRILSNYLIHEDQPDKTKNFLNEFVAKLNPDYAEDLADELEILKEQHDEEHGHKFETEEDKNKHFINSISRFLLKSFNHDIKFKNKKKSKFIKVVNTDDVSYKLYRRFICLFIL